jgi:phosphoribosyl 1,2-cyclic phosphate phosphodiesterase
MEIIFLGTGASEAIPCPFCRCDYCSQARRSGGKDIRTRSSLRLGRQHQIDFAPDVVSQLVKNNLDVFDLEHLLITHTHEDHLALGELMTRECAVPLPDRPVILYMNKRAAAWVKSLVSALWTGMNEQARARQDMLFSIVETDYFQPFQAGQLQVTPIKANHRAFGPDEYAQNYLIRLPDGQCLLYAVDTGWYGEETWEFLSAQTVDILIMEATFGGRTDRGLHPDGHLDAASYLLMADKMSALGVIDHSTRLYATHINHKHTLMHDGLQQCFNRSDHQITVAWDGLTIDC